MSRIWRSMLRTQKGMHGKKGLMFARHVTRYLKNKEK
jgi:hypothetical protein